MKAGNAKNSVASVCVSNYNKLGAVFIFVKEGKIMQEKEKGGFSFINEQIKEKPLNKKRLIKKALFTVVLAVIFGTREFDTLKSKKVPQSLEIGLFFCQIFIFII